MAARTPASKVHVLLVALVVTACSHGGLSTTSTDPVDDGPSIEQIIEQEGTQSQAEYLADGQVTPAEREAAFFAWVSCMEAKGVQVTDYTLNPRGGETIDVDSELAEDTQDQIVRDCRQEYYLAVSAVFSRQNGLTQQEEAEQAAQIAQCMRDKGLDVPEGLTFLELQDIDGLQAGLCYEAAAGGG